MYICGNLETIDKETICTVNCMNNLLYFLYFKNTYFIILDRWVENRRVGAHRGQNIVSDPLEIEL